MMKCSRNILQEEEQYSIHVFRSKGWQIHESKSISKLSWQLFDASNRHSRKIELLLMVLRNMSHGQGSWLLDCQPKRRYWWWCHVPINNFD